MLRAEVVDNATSDGCFDIVMCNEVVLRRSKLFKTFIVFVLWTNTWEKRGDPKRYIARPFVVVLRRSLAGDEKRVLVTWTIRRPRLTTVTHAKHTTEPCNEIK